VVRLGFNSNLAVPHDQQREIKTEAVQVDAEAVSGANGSPTWRATSTGVIAAYRSA
jgi:hypothetical protein